MSFNKRKGPLCIIAASVFWSFGGLCIKLIPWGAMSIIGLRSLLAAVVFIIFRRSFKLDISRGNVLAAICLSLTIIFFVLANKMTTAAAAILLQFSAPVFIILINLVCYKTRPRTSEAAAVLVTILGMLLFFADQLEPGGLFGNILAILSGFAFAGLFICNRRADVDPQQSALLGFLINATIGLPFVPFQITADPVAWGSVVFMGVFQVGLAYIFFSVGIKSTPALVACLITALEPVLNPVWVALFANETPGPFAIAGGCVIIVTVLVFNIWTEKHSAQTDGQ